MFQDPEQTTIAKFTPNNPHGKYPNELYYKSKIQQNLPVDAIKSNTFDDFDESFFDKLDTSPNADEGLLINIYHL